MRFAFRELYGEYMKLILARRVTLWKSIEWINVMHDVDINYADFRKLDFSSLKLTVSGGMALQLATAERWKEVTGCAICEGYGMTESAPVLTVIASVSTTMSQRRMPYSSAVRMIFSAIRTRPAAVGPMR